MHFLWYSRLGTVPSASLYLLWCLYMYAQLQNVKLLGDKAKKKKAKPRKCTSGYFVKKELNFKCFSMSYWIPFHCHCSVSIYLYGNYWQTFCLLDNTNLTSTPGFLGPNRTRKRWEKVYLQRYIIHTLFCYNYSILVVCKYTYFCFCLVFFGFKWILGYFCKGQCKCFKRTVCSSFLWTFRVLVLTFCVNFPGILPCPNCSSQQKQPFLMTWWSPVGINIFLWK